MTEKKKIFQREKKTLRKEEEKTGRADDSCLCPGLFCFTQVDESVEKIQGRRRNKTM